MALILTINSTITLCKLINNYDNSDMSGEEKMVYRLTVVYLRIDKYIWLDI